MTTVWRGGEVGPGDRTDSFLHASSESFVPYGEPAEMGLAEHDEVRMDSVGMLQVMRLDLTRVELTRTPRLIRQSDPALCKIDVQLSGRSYAEQGDRQAALGPGTFTFIDLSRPHRVAVRHARVATIWFPRALLPLRDRDIAELAGATFDGEQRGSTLVTATVREMVKDLDAYDGPAGARIGAPVLDLILATLAARVDRAHAVPAETPRQVLVMRIRAFIDDNLGDPDLAPPVIAARFHISLRHLHHLFEDQDTTVAGLIRDRRLAACRHDLLDPGQAAKPVSAIAARRGFRDAPHFGQVFRAAYGMSPGAYRRSFT